MAEHKSFYRQLVPNGRRRSNWHDYRSRCIYMITLNKADCIPRFSTIKGIPGDYINKPYTDLSPTGKIIAANVSALKHRFPFISILRRCIMPDHIHFVIFVKEKTSWHLGDIVNHLKSVCTRNYNGYDSRRGEGADETLVSMFEDGYHDRILRRKNQLKRMLKYVSDNPRRSLERTANRGFHRRLFLEDIGSGGDAGAQSTFSCGDAGIGVPSSCGGTCEESFMETGLGRVRYEAYGNIHLLEDPELAAVRISRRFSEDELRKRKINWLRTVGNCGVLVSPFISQAEKKVRDWALANGGRFILIESNGFGERYSPKGILHQLCNEGRLLIIAPTEHHTSPPKLTYSECQRMNALAERIEQYLLRPC